MPSDVTGSEILHTKDPIEQTKELALLEAYLKLRTGRNLFPT